MELHIKDRLFLPQILPVQNSFMDFNLKKSIINKTVISEEERASFNIKEDKEAGKITWDSEKDRVTPLNVEFTKEELDYLRRGCEALASDSYADDFWITVEKIYNAAQ